MDEEIGAIEKNKTRELIDLPSGKKPIGVKWVYKTKYKANGEVDRLKARLVVKGYKQQAGIDYLEVFAPVARLDTVRMIVTLAAQNRWKIYQMDVKSAFLNGVLEEEVYVEKPAGYIKRGQERKVYKLRKALYGLKQAPRTWYTRIDSYFLKNGFLRCPYEHTLYVKSGHNDILIVCLYVDDLIFAGNNEELIAEFKDTMVKEFEMTDLGLMSYFLGIEVSQTDSGIFISQKKYAVDILKRFRMDSCKSVSTPMQEKLKLSKEGAGSFVDAIYFKQIVGSLRYLTANRLDIVHAVGLISRFMEAPRQSHLQAANRILRYIKGTQSDGMFYSCNRNHVELIGYTDSDWGGDPDQLKSTSGYAFHLGSTIFSWSSKKQPVVTLSTAEAEYVAANGCATQAVWLRRMLGVLQHMQTTPTKIFCDSTSAIKMAKNPVFNMLGTPTI